jgi:chemotaxis protein histidine kinase CheA
MIHLEEELAQDYLAECNERVLGTEADLLAIAAAGQEADPESVDRAFRALHWIQGGAGVFDLVRIADLARQMEAALELIRSRVLIPTRVRVDVLLAAK